MQLRSLHVIHQAPVYHVWRGESADLNQRFTVKQLRPETQTMEVHITALQRETEFLQKFCHPRLLAVANHESPNTVFYEDVQCSLPQLLEKHGRLSNELVAGVMAQCLEALALLASKDHAHGMLCCENLFVDPAGTVKLGDFTGYRFERDRPALGSFYKLPANLAPEIIDKSRGPCGPWSDLYCLGFVALKMLAADQLPKLMGLTGYQEDPQRCRRWHDDPNQTLNNWQEQLPDLSSGLGDFIDGLIRKNAEQRAFRSPAAALVKLNELGLRARRTLPLFDQQSKAAATTEARFRPPQRKLGPMLRLTPRGETRNSKPVIVPHDKPLIVNCTVSEDGRQRSERRSLLACQSQHWYVYNLSDRAGTFHNTQPVLLDSPRRISTDDELRFGNDRYLVDLILQGTSAIRGFDLLKRMHRGSGGDYYLARWHRRSSKSNRVVVRILPRDFGSDVDEIRRFLRAIPSAGRIRHPNVVRLWKGGRVRRFDGSTWYIASELMERGSLRDRIERSPDKPLPLRVIRRIGIDVANALTAARSHRVIHRNINPACILFDRNKNVKLGDFSLLRTQMMDSMYDITRGNLLPGDYLYQAPEVLLASSDIDQTCDFFSLAVCLYEAILGRLPVEANESVADMISRMSRYEWPSIRELKSGVPEAWEQVLARCLARDPGQRYCSPDELKAAFAELPT